MTKPMKTKPEYVYAVLYEYDYEGRSLEGVYRTKRAADKHCYGGDRTLVQKWKVQNKPRPDQSK